MAYHQTAVPSFVLIRSFVTRFLIALLAGFVLLSAALWGEDEYAKGKIESIEKHVFRKGLLKASGGDDDPGKPANFLIVGSDTRDFVKTGEDAIHFGDSTTQAGNRSDTIMIAHIDPNSREAFIVSLPRDTGVKIPGGCSEKINATFNADYKCGGQRGGPEMLVQTIKENFDVDINHYLEVDFVGFRQIVDVLESVEIYFPTPARDKYTGLSVEGGCQRLDGLMALNYARSRHYEYFDYSANRWRQDPTADFGRIRRQQYLIRTLMQVGIDRGAKNPRTGLKLVDKMVNFVGSDDQFNLGDVKRLVNTFSVTDPGSVPMETLPVKSGSGGRLQLQQPEAELTLQRLRTFAPPPPKATTTTAAIDNGDVQVLLRNGTANPQTADTANGQLRKLGFQTTDVEVVGTVAKTEIHYTASQAGKALVVAKYLGGIGKLVQQPTIAEGDVTIVMGTDWRGVVDPATTPTTRPRTTTTVPSAIEAPKPNPGKPPTDADPKSVGGQFIGCQL